MGCDCVNNNVSKNTLELNLNKTNNINLRESLLSNKNIELNFNNKDNNNKLTNNEINSNPLSDNLIKTDINTSNNNNSNNNLNFKLKYVNNNIFEENLPNENLYKKFSNVFESNFENKKENYIYKNNNIHKNINKNGDDNDLGLYRMKINENKEINSNDFIT